MRNKITIFTLMITTLLSMFTLVGCTTSNESELLNNGVNKTNYDFELPDDLSYRPDDEAGVQMAMCITIGGDYTLEDALKIASHYTAWVDGERVPITDYEVSFRFSNQRLSGYLIKDGINQNPNISAGVGYDYDREIGNYIYLETAMCPNGTLLLDENETYTHTPEQMLEYVINREYTVKYLHPVSFQQQDIVAGFDENVVTYYSSPYGFSKIIKMHITVDNFDNLINTSTADIYIQPLISPDDDLEDAVSEYNIQLIETVFMPRTLFGPSFISALRDVILLKNGEFCDESITVSSAYPTIDNVNNYNLTMSVKLPDDVWYKKTIEVILIESNYDMGYVALEDGTFVTVKHCNDEYTNEEIIQGINEFIEYAFGYTSNDITINEPVELTKVYHGTFNGSPLKIINSGLGSLKFSTADDPIDTSASKRGFQVVNEIYYTSNYTVEEVVQVIGRDLLLYNGQKPTEDYKVIAEIDNIGLHLEIHIGTDVVTWRNIKLIEVTDSKMGNYILGKHHSFVNPIIYIQEEIHVMSKEIFNMMIKEHYFNEEVYLIKNDGVLTGYNRFDAEGIYTNASGNYYQFNASLEVINLEEKIENTNIEWYEEPEPELEPTDYEIIKIDTIYYHDDIKINAVLDSLKKEILLKNGIPNSSNYTITVRQWMDQEYPDDFIGELYVSFPDGVSRIYEVNVVKLAKNQMKMGAAVLENGDILMVSFGGFKYDEHDVRIGINNFLMNYVSESSSVTLNPQYSSFTSTQTYYGNMYDTTKEIIYCNSGSTGILNTTKDDPVDDEAQKEGYDLYHTIHYTSNYKLEDVLNIVGKYILLNNGIPVKADYKVYIEFYDTGMVTMEITYNGNVLIKDVVRLKVVDNSPVGNYIYAETYLYNNGLLIVEGSNDPKHEFNDIFNYLIKTYHAAWEDIDLDQEIQLNQESNHTIKEVIYNGTYWNYYLDVKITDFNNELEDSNVDFEDEFIFPGYPDDPNPSDPTNPETDSNESMLARILVITLSTVVGVVIIVILVKGCKKIAYWLK